MSKRPHIVIFNPDQWRSDVMGHMGNPAAENDNFRQIKCREITNALAQIVNYFIPFIIVQLFGWFAINPADAIAGSQRLEAIRRAAFTLNSLWIGTPEMNRMMANFGVDVLHPAINLAVQ